MESIFGSWIILSIVIAFIGSNRRIGFWAALLLSIFLSPLIGLIVVLVSKSKETEAHERRIVTLQNEQTRTLQQLAKPKVTNVATELLGLKQLKDSGDISEDEYQNLRKRILEGEGNSETPDEYKTNVDWFKKYAGPTLTHKLVPNQELSLVRDFNYQNGLQVYLGGLPIGYVPSEVAAIVEPKIANGTPYKASVLSFDPYASGDQKVQIRILV